MQFLSNFIRITFDEMFVYRVYAVAGNALAIATRVDSLVNVISTIKYKTDTTMNIDRPD